MGRLHFSIDGDADGFIRATRQAEAAAGDLVSKVTSEGGQVDAMFKKMAAGAAALFSINTAKNFVKQVYEVRSSFQDAESSLATFLGSAEKGTQFFNELKDYAWYNMFEFSDLLEASNQLIAFGNATEDIIPIIDQLSNIASGTNKPLAEYIDLWNKAKSTGKVGAEYMQSWAAHGIVLKDTLKEMGVEVSGSTITFEQLQMAIKHVTDEGGRFHGLMANMMENLSSSVGQLQDDLANMLNELGERWQGAMKKGIEGASALISNYDKIGKALAGLIAAYGSYKVVLAAVAVIQKSSLLAKQTVEWVKMARALGVATANQVAFNTAAKANVYVALASAVIGVATAIFAFNKRQAETIKTQGEATRKITEETQALKGLFDAAQDQTKSEGDRAEAIEKINARYGDKLENLLTEKSTVEELAGAYRQLTAAITGKYLAELKESMVGGKQEKFDDAQDTLYGRIQKIASKSGLSMERQGSMVAKMQEWIAKYGKYNDTTEIYNEMMRIYSLYGGKGLTANQSKRLLWDIWDYKTTKSELDAAEEGYEEYAAGYKSVIEDVTEATGEAAEEQRTSLADIVKELESALAKIKSLRAKAAKEGLTEAEDKELGQATAAYDAAGKKYKEYTGRDYGKDGDNYASAQAKLLKQRRDARKAAAREMEDLEGEVAQAEVDAMADGAEKTRKQRELDGKLEIRQIERRKEDYIDALVERARAIYEAEQAAAAAKDGTYKKKSFDEAGARKTAEGSQGAQAYDAIIAGTRDKQERGRLEAEADAMREYLIKYGTYEEKRLGITQKYAALIAKAETEGERMSLAKRQEEELYELEQAYKKTAGAIQDLFADLSTKSAKDLNAIADEGENALAFLKGGEWSKDNAFGISEEAFNQIKDDPSKLKDIADAIEQIRDKADDLEPSLKKITEGIKEFINAGDGTEAFGDSLAKIKSGLGEITSAAGFLSESFSSVGDALGVGWMTDAANGIDSALNVVDTTMKGAEIGASFGPIGAAAGAAIGLVSSLTTEIGKAHDAAKQKTIDRLANDVAKLGDAYDDLADSIDKAYSVDKADLIEQQNANLEAQNANLEKMIEAEEGKKKSDKKQIEEWRKQIKENGKLIEENAEKAQEAINGISFDTFRDKFKDSLMDMEGDADDWADDVSDIIRDAMYENLLADFNKEAEPLLEELAEAQRAGDEARIKSIEGRLAALYGKYKPQAERIDENYGSDTSSRSATNKGIAQASQDTVDELNGRATAIQSHTFSINERVGEVVSLSTQMLARLTNIDANTARLGAIEDAMKYLRDDLSAIRTRGITVKT